MALLGMLIGSNIYPDNDCSKQGVGGEGLYNDFGSGNGVVADQHCAEICWRTSFLGGELWALL